MRAFLLRGAATTTINTAGASFAASMLMVQARLQGTSSSASQSVQTAGASVGSSNPAAAVSPMQQLYKSSHRGSGTVPMPKPLKSKKLKSHSIPALSDAEAAILGARSSCAEDQGPVPERPLTPLQRRQLLFKNKAAFVLTPQALRRVKYLLSQYAANHSEALAPGTAADSAGETAKSAARPVGIHIGVRRRGCSGYSYTVNYYFPPTAEEAQSKKAKERKGGMHDVVVEQDDVKVVVDGDALFYVIGTEMDYVVRNVEEKFTFKNPNQKYSCGCEESFMPFDEDDLDD